MDEILAEFISQDNTQLPIKGFIINLGLTALLSAILALIYIFFGRSLSNRKAFAANFVLIAMTTMMIIAIVQHSLALSLGLVGALSIVRFRAAIKEPEELAFIFLNISIGLGFGANQRVITIIAFALIVTAVVIYGFIGWKRTGQNLFITVALDAPDADTGTKVIEILKKHCKTVNLKRLDASKNIYEASFLIDLSDYSALENCQQDLLALNPNFQLSFLDNKNITG